LEAGNDHAAARETTFSKIHNDMTIPASNFKKRVYTIEYRSWAVKLTKLIKQVLHSNIQ
jgi:hypothetical protein